MALGTGFIWAQLKANRDKIKFCYPREKITSFVLITASGTKMILWHWQDEFQDKFCWQDLVGGCYCLSEVWGGEKCAETGEANGGGLWLTMGLGELCLSPSFRPLLLLMPETQGIIVMKIILLGEEGWSLWVSHHTVRIRQIPFAPPRTLQMVFYISPTS